MDERATKLLLSCAPDIQAKAQNSGQTFCRMLANHSELIGANQKVKYACQYCFSGDRDL